MPSFHPTTNGPAMASASSTTITSSTFPNHRPVSTSTPKPARAKSELPKMSKELSAFLQSFYDAEPSTLEAADIIHDINNGESVLLDLPMKEQILLLYKVFQHYWLRSLSEL
jgi:hypothetical protein